MDTSDDFLPLLHSPDTGVHQDLEVRENSKACLNCDCLQREPRKWSTTGNLHYAILKSCWQPLKSSQRLPEIFSNDLGQGL